MEQLTEFIPKGKRNRPGTKINPTKITIHNTGNTSKGANAKAHSKFVRNTGHYIRNGKKIWVSWHFTVDDKYIIAQMPTNEKAYHAASTGNRESIGIEICMHQEIDQVKANDKAAQLIAYLCKELQLTPNDVVTHKHWTNKNCPQLLLPNWNVFISQIQHYYNTMEDDDIIMLKTTIVDADRIKSNDQTIDLNSIEFKFNGCLMEGENN